MPAVDPIIKHGLIPDLDMPKDEPNMLVNSLTITPSREKQEFKGGAAQVVGLRFVNPLLTFAFDGYISAVAGLADEHPGKAVTNLANYTGAIHGFDKADGVMIYEDPSREASNDDLAKAKFNVVQYPFVEAPPAP